MKTSITCEITNLTHLSLVVFKEVINSLNKVGTQCAQSIVLHVSNANHAGRLHGERWDHWAGALRHWAQSQGLTHGLGVELVDQKFEQHWKVLLHDLLTLGIANKITLL